MKLSIIVPVYNVEKYIITCATSLLNQSVDKGEYEIIFVNDGTKDDSAKLLSKFISANDNCNMRLFNKQNGGLSDARNYGFGQSHGDYVWFVDSDDWLDDCLQEIFPLLSDCDIVEFSSHYREESGRTLIESRELIGNRGKDITKCLYWHPVQFHIFRRQFLENSSLNFKYGVLHEDSQFTPRALYLAQKVMIYQKPVYHYLCRPGSITQNIKTKNVFDLMGNIEDLLLFQKNSVDVFDQLGWGMTSVFPVINGLLYMSCLCKDNQQKELVKSFVNKHKEFINYYVSSTELPYRLIGFLVTKLGFELYSVYSLLFPIRYKLLRWAKN